MRQMRALLMCALFLFSMQLWAHVLTLDAKTVNIVNAGETGIGLVSGKSPEPLIIFGQADRFYVQSALASALSLDTCIKIDTSSHQLFVGYDAQLVEDGWLIDARFVRKEGDSLVFRKFQREIALDGSKEQFEKNCGMSGFLVVGKDGNELSAEYFPFDQFVLSAADQNADGKPTIRFRGFESKNFREVGKDLNWETIRRGSRLGSINALPTVVQAGPAARFRTITQAGVPTGDKFPSWRFPTGAILLSHTDAHDLGAALARLKRNDDGQNQLVLVKLHLNGKWALLKVLKESQTLFVDWSGQSTEAHLSQFLPRNNLVVRRVETLRAPKRGEEESEPMFEKLEELLKEQVSPRALLSPRTTAEVLQQAAATMFGVDKTE